MIEDITHKNEVGTRRSVIYLYIYWNGKNAHHTNLLVHFSCARFVSIAIAPSFVGI